MIWIAKEFREEHRQALDWLNSSTGSEVQFFAVVLEVWKIDDSKPAVNLKLVAFPKEWRKTNVREPGAGPTSELGERYRAFFQNLIDELREKHRSTAAWITDIRDQCTRAGVPFFFKQWGGFQKSRTGRLLDGRTWDELPPAWHSRKDTSLFEANRPPGVALEASG